MKVKLIGPKTLILMMTVIFSLFFQNVAANACSTFVVYGEKIYYGMNWDYYIGTDSSFYIISKDNMKVFNACDEEGSSFTGYNTKGLFANKIMVYPIEKFGALSDFNKKSLEIIDMRNLYEKALFNYSSVDEINEYIKDKKVMGTQMDMHNIFADVYGKAEAVEVGKDENMITAIDKEPFFLAANFSKYYYKNVDYKDIRDKSSDRYIAGYDYILENYKDFDVFRGIGMLEAMKCEESGFNTLCSFLYEPSTNSVYIAISRDYNRIWKISIDDETIETFAGFENQMKFKMGKSIKLSDLKKISNYDMSTINKFEDKFLIKPDPNLNLVSKEFKDDIEMGESKKVIVIAVIIIGIIFIIIKINKKLKSSN